MAQSTPSEGGGESGDAHWRLALRRERELLGITQAELARKANLSLDTIRKYESGSRVPGREALERIFDVLQVSLVTRREILLERGFHHPDTRFPPEKSPDYYFTVAELQTFVEEVPWPQFVANELGEIAAANRAAQTLWGIDFALEKSTRDRANANLFVAMAEPAFGERIVNWTEICRFFVALLKAVPEGRAMMDDAGPLFEQILAAFMRAAPERLMTLYQLWETTPRRDDKVRWMYPVVWQEPGFPQMRFKGIVSPASEPEGLGVNDWVPADAASHATLERILAEKGREPSPRTPPRRRSR